MNRDTAHEPPTIWLRAERKPLEARVALVPADAARLIAAGHEVVVEASAQRAIPIEDYVAAGCGTAAEGAWRDAPERVPDRAIVLGLKELDPALGPFRHRHVHFAHAFKGQRGWRDTLAAFATGGGALFDLEYLVDAAGRRVAAFGHWAGFVGAALALLALRAAEEGDRLPALEPWASAEALLAEVRAALAGRATPPRVLVIGARGRSGRGAVELCRACGVEPSAWDIDETAAGGPFDAALAHDALISCVFVDGPIPPFTTRAHLAGAGRRLRSVVDVGCDPHGAHNPLPLYEEPTTLGAPVLRLEGIGEPPLDLIAIDHLPSLLPLESSVDFSAQLLPQLLTLDRPEGGVWARAAAVFEARLHEATGVTG